jgi:hypothetical protein
VKTNYPFSVLFLVTIICYCTNPIRGYLNAKISRIAVKSLKRCCFMRKNERLFCCCIKP